MSSLNGIIAPSSGSGHALLAGDEDGQVIQGLTGADQARISLGVFDAGEGQELTSITGAGATPSKLIFYENGYVEVSTENGNFVSVSDDGFTATAASAVGVNQIIISASGINLNAESSGQVVGISTDRFRVVTNQTPPTNANDTGTTGDFIVTDGFIYFCVNTDTWQRVAIATWGA